MGIADNQWMSWALWTISEWGFLLAGTRLMDKSRSSGATLPKASLFCKIMFLFIFIDVHMCCCRVTNLIVRKITVNQNFLYMKLPLQGRFWFALSQFCFWNIKWVGGSCKTTTLYLWTPKRPVVSCMACWASVVRHEHNHRILEPSTEKARNQIISILDMLSSSRLLTCRSLWEQRRPPQQPRPWQWASQGRFDGGCLARRRTALRT